MAFSIPAATQHILLILSYIDLFVNVIACVLFYSFKAQRKFPCAALGWTTIFNIMINLYSVAIEHGVPASYSECRATLFIESGLTFGLIASNNVLVLILFVSVRLRRPMETTDDKRWFIGCITFVIAITIIMAFVMEYIPYSAAHCSWQVPWLYVPLSVGLFLLSIQLIFLGLSMHQVVLIIGRSRDTNCSKRDYRLYILSVRLILVFFFQSFEFFPLYLTEIVNLNAEATALFIKITGSTMDALVLTFSNRALLRKILPIVFKHSSSSDDKTSSNMSKRASKQSKNSSADSGSVPTTAEV